MADPIYRVGPCHVFFGNPNQAAGAGMQFLGFTRDDVELTPTVNISSGRVDQIGTSGLADAAWFGGMDPTVSVPLVDEDKDKLAAYITYGAKITNSGKTSFGFGSGFKKFTPTEVGTLALIPSDELSVGTNGVDAPNGVWLPAAVCVDIGSFMYSLPDNNNDAMSRRSTQFRGLRLQYDVRPTSGNTLLTGNARRQIPASHRICFIGPPGSVPTDATFGEINGWSLPAAPTG